jgi:hypothetical protein
VNPGLAIFKKRHRLQGGTEDVRDKVPPFFVNGKWWWERANAEDAPLRPMSEMPENEEDLSPEELRREQEDYKRRVRESKYIQAQQGNSNVGLNLFRRKQMLRKPKP